MMMFRLLIIFALLSSPAMGQLTKTYGEPLTDGFTYRSLKFNRNGTYIDRNDGCVGSIEITGSYTVIKDTIRLTRNNQDGRKTPHDITIWVKKGKKIYYLSPSFENYYLIEEKYVKQMKY